MNNHYYISDNKERHDMISLIESIKKQGEINENTILVNCYPDYSSRISHFLNHKLSHLNNNELFMRIDIDMPYLNMSQVFNRDTESYQLFDNYLIDWVRKNIFPYNNYLLLSSSIINGRDFTKLRNVIKQRAEYRFATLYLKATDFEPDFYVERVDKFPLFEWENINNLNFK